MKPFFFGSSQKPLYGIYHPPIAGSPRNGNAVLCYPFGREYLRAHRAMRELANRLARAGFHTLRFDYYGCGDSAGGGEEADLEEWIGDIVLAIDELSELNDSDRLTVVGLRLGAALAALAGNRREAFSNLVLWDPVVRGKQYVDELMEAQEAWRMAHPSLGTEQNPEPDDHVLGFPLTDSLRAAMERIDLPRLTKCPAQNILIVTSADSASARDLRNTLKEQTSVVDYRHIHAAKIWLRQEGVDQALVPVQTIQAISEWVTHERKSPSLR